MSSRDWDSVIPFGELKHEVDRIFDSFLGGIGRGLPFRMHGAPAVNLWENEECFCVEAEVPDLTMDDIEVQVVGSELTIKGRWKATQAENVTYHRQERQSGEFSRSLDLPREVRTEKVEAVLKDGLLIVTLPKSAIAKVQKIAVKGE